MDYLAETIKTVPGTIISFSLLSQGFATAPGAIVLYEHDNDPITPYIVHTINFQTFGMSSGNYFDNLPEALERFVNKLNQDQSYIKSGSPLTGQNL